MASVYVENGVTIIRLPLIPRDKLELFDSNPEINLLTQAYAPAKTVVNIDDMVETNTRTFVGVGAGLYVTHTKKGGAKDVVAAKITLCSCELGCFILLSVVYIMCVFWYVAIGVILSGYVLVKLGVVGGMMRLFLGNPVYNGVTITGPTGELYIPM